MASHRETSRFVRSWRRAIRGPCWHDTLRKQRHQSFNLFALISGEPFDFLRGIVTWRKAGPWGLEQATLRPQCRANKQGSIVVLECSNLVFMDNFGFGCVMFREVVWVCIVRWVRLLVVVWKWVFLCGLLLRCFGVCNESGNLIYYYYIIKFV